MSSTEQQYWQSRYEAQRTGWDIGYPSTPLKTYFDQLENKDLRILIPGAGNAYEAEYLWQQGFKQVSVIDIAPAPLTAFKARCPDFPEDQLHLGDFFTHQGSYDLIIEQTFFCSFHPAPETRKAYAKQMHQLLKPGGRLVGLWFEFPLTTEPDKRPYGGTRTEYLAYLRPFFRVHTFAPSYNSIPPRAGKELFGIFIHP
ncbi:MAG: methyltransferase domain-containing protein [Bacteroidota bacterium]